MARTAERTTRTRGCHLVVAAAGYGKTTALHAAGATILHAASDLITQVPDVGHLAVDAVCGLPVRDQVQLFRTLATVPDDVQISVAGRRPLGAAAIAALPGPVTERGPADLALPPDVVAALLRDEYGVADPDLARRVHDLTAGWPALVRLAGDVLARHEIGPSDLLPALTEPGTAAATWIRQHVLPGTPPQVAELLEVAGDLDPVSASLCAAIAGNPERAIDPVRWLADTGLLVAEAHRGRPRKEPTFRLVPVVAAVLRQQRPPAATVGGRLDTAATWYLANGHPLAAVRGLGAAGRSQECAALIESRGDEILASGGATDLARVIEALPPGEQTPGVRLILGDTLRMAGDVAGALRTFAPLIEQAELTGAWPPRLTWRAAMLHYMRADYHRALELLDRAEPAATAPDADDALFQACRANVLHLLGRNDDAAVCAALAVDHATATGDDRAAASAHIAAALTSVGVHRDEHLAAALAAAERAGDVIQEARVLVNQADCLLRDARYPQALAVAARAVRTAERGAPPGILVTALHNAGEALARIGRYDEAFLHFERSMRVSRRVGLKRVASALYGIAEVHRQLGRREQSRVAFEEAADLARTTAEVQILVPALAGIARLLLDGAAPDLDAARSAADEAEQVAPPMLAPCALVARGWVALFEGDRPMAQQRASDAVRAARAGRQADLLAESLELAAAVTAEPQAARAALQEAAAIWTRAGARPAADRLLVLMGRAPGADGTERLAARAAAARLLALGVQAIGGAPLQPVEGAATPVQIRVLGQFEVLVGGQPVPLPAWRSRQARTLLKILVGRRGRPVPRSELCELLWPDDDPQRTGHRLSVLLSAVRTVLDPTKLWPTDHYVRADLAGISLDLSRVTVDVEHLLVDAAHGIQLARDGDVAGAREILSDVDTAYRGDAFDDEPYEEWADGFREQARAVWLQGLRELADLCRRAGNRNQAAACLVRLLVADPYDEAAHRALVEVLVGAGRHGEARRAHDRWAKAMRSIDAPLPDRGVLSHRATVGRRQQGTAFGT